MALQQAELGFEAKRCTWSAVDEGRWLDALVVLDPPQELRDS